MTDVAPRPPLASVALLSSAALATEILLSRSFAVVHWHHFAYMIISLALLGFGASGTFLALAHRRLLRHFAASYLGNVAAFGILVVASPVLAQALPFQAEALLWDPWQPLWLVLLYLVLSTPFFCAANAIGLALIAFRDCAGRVYAADLVGAGVGSVVLLGLLYWLWPEDLLRIIAAAGFVAICLGAFELRARPRVWVGAAVIGVAATIAIPTALLRFEPGPYKGLSQALLVDGTRVTLERSSPLGRVSVIESPRVPLRSAPGLSLGSASEPPDQVGVFTDGDNLQVITAASGDDERLAFLAETTSALAYRIATPRTVFVPGAGGGMEILRAQRFDAQLVDAVELNPQVADLLRVEFRGYTGGLLERPGVRLHVGDARGFLAATDRRYDLIQMSLTGVAAGGGLGGLNEDYLHTVEAFRLYLGHLEPGGLLSITRWAQIPPRDSLKLVATVIAALESSGAADAADRLLMIRGWQTSTLLVKNGPVTTGEVQRLREFCAALSFDVVWFPGIRAEDVNIYNQLPAPWYFDGVQALLGPDRADFTAAYAFDIRPATDDRPYFQNFFRWPVLTEAWRAKDRGGMALLEAGYLLLVTTLVQALLAGLLLILLPLVLFAPLARTHRRVRWQVFAYFTGIGLAFLFVEIAFLQKLMLLVHHPTVALSLVLATFLLGAGAGSAWSSRVPVARSRILLSGAVVGIVLLGALYGAAFDALIGELAAWPTPARALVAAGLLAPLAFCMGMPFPLALRELDEPLVPWAWGINGCASVVSAALATLLAVDFGFSVVLWIALALYVLVLMVFPRRRETQALLPD
jgi:spermidine synthase